MPKKLKIILVVLIIFLVVFVLDKFLFKSFKDSVFSVFSPIQKFLWSQNNVFSNGLDSFFNSKNLQEKNSELEKENLFLKAQALKLKGVQEENEELKNVLSLGLNKKFILIMAEVISKKTQEDSMLINKGKSDGVKEGMTAISKENVLIGRVKNVFGDFSEIELITKKDFVFSAEVELKDGNVLGACRGKGNYELKMELLPKEKNLEENNVVFTAILGGVFPKNLLIGEIKNIEKKDAEPFQNCDVEPYFKELDLEIIFLIEQK